MEPEDEPELELEPELEPEPDAPGNWGIPLGNWGMEPLGNSGIEPPGNWGMEPLAPPPQLPGFCMQSTTGFGRLLVQSWARAAAATHSTNTKYFIMSERGDGLACTVLRGGVGDWRLMPWSAGQPPFIRTFSRSLWRGQVRWGRR